ncbi:sensor histidine kinase [Dyadobacter chenwenxiniae]|uniref:Sensor histidine kinase n=1 Tax=Dyadobacter chenwenxiniae TaxID=2906456 RepID=A0A9X1PPW9_9BACT|nr:sensor histidine kinase [Dyadobacter chenwenxiniae]MCF0062661.1 sensor histidine kinase [Dyadobacter chenwenxiniae]UON83596.1 sensor histidine kinase [Dyadobacter chenwenxiniae]
MKKIHLIALHVGYWLLFAFLISFVFFISQASDGFALPDTEDWIAILLFSLLTGISSFYAFYLWLVPRYLVTRNINHFVRIGLLISLGVAILSVLLVSLVTTVIIYIALNQWQWILFSGSDQLILLAGFTLLALVNALTGALLRASITWYTDIHLKEQIANQALQTELALLKSQLNPHFLFNTLHNIDILIGHDAAKASAYLNKLSDLLRFSLYETQANQIPLAQEIASIEKYIELQKIRMSNEQYVSLLIDGQADGLEITPMLFMPYIENAFKYAANKKITDGIRINIKISNEHIHFQCVNVIDPSKLTRENQGGIGQKLLGKRLALLYPERHKLLVKATDTTYSVDLTLSLKTYALPAD